MNTTKVLLLFLVLSVCLSTLTDAISVYDRSSLSSLNKYKKNKNAYININNKYYYKSSSLLEDSEPYSKSGIQCPDGSWCSSSSTCCPSGNGGYSCCPMSNGSCCSDFKHCCPSGFTCTDGGAMCVPPGYKYGHIYEKN